MKSKISIIILVFAALLMAGCSKPKEVPTENDLKTYLAELKLYYPYAVNEQFVFVNETTCERLEVKAMPEQDNEYPITSYGIHEEDPESMSYEMWSIDIYAPMINNEFSMVLDMDSHIAGKGLICDGILWMFSVKLDSKYSYIGVKLPDASDNDVLSLFTDTVEITEISKTYIDDFSGEIQQESAPSGSYARIVRNKGLTDFCIDGKTVWRRVK